MSKRFWAARAQAYHFCAAQVIGVAMFATVANAAPPSKPEQTPTCALIDFDRSPLAAVLEAKLLAEVEATWLERSAIDKVVQEQELQALFSPEGGVQRVALGKLLKAELLILVRNAPPPSADESAKAPAGEKAVQAIDLTVTETRRGLRLCSRAVPRSDNAEADADTLVKMVREALAKYAQQVTEIYAVPPFVSGDLGYEYDYLRGTYAKLLEQMLLDRPGALVVELAEAQALAKEVALADPGSRLKRDVPFYLLGEYRNDGHGDDHHLRLSLKLMRGEQKLDERTLESVVPNKAAATLRELAAKLVEKAAGAKHAAVDPEAEVDAINRREKLFLRLGQWSDALSLAEASLLLMPGQTEMHHDAIVALTMLSRQNWDSFPFDINKQWKAVGYQNRGLEHIELFVRLGGRPEQYDGPRGMFDGFIVHLFRATGGNISVNPGYPAEKNQTIVALQKARTAALKDLIPRLAHAGWKDERFLLDPLLMSMSVEEQFDVMLRLIDQVKDLPETKMRTFWYAHAIRLGPEVKTPEQRLRSLKPFYERLAEIDNTEVRAVAQQLIRDEERYIKQQAEKEARDMQALSREAAIRAKARPVSGVRQIEFTWYDDADNGRLGSIDGCLPAGDGVDVVWAGSSLYLMKKGGVLRRVWQGQINWGFQMIVANMHCSHVCYDGRFVWAVAGTYGGVAPRLLVVDPRSEAVFELTVDDGLPQSTTVPTGFSRKQVMAVAPIGPGKVCVAGSFGQTWLATATFDLPIKKTFKVFHEARHAFDRESSEQPKGTDVAFVPGFMLTLDPQRAGKHQNRRIVVGRAELNGRYPPLSIDPDALAVEALIPAEHLEGYYARCPRSPIVYRGGIHVFWASRVKPGIYRLALPDFKPEIVLENAPDGFVAFTGDRLHIVARDWWTWHVGDDVIRHVAEGLPWWFGSGWSIAGRPPSAPETPQLPRLEGIFSSSHYGLLVKRAWSTQRESAIFEVSRLLEKADEAPLVEGGTIKAVPSSIGPGSRE